jgi:SAM-dependent methyltransferase
MFNKRIIPFLKKQSFQPGIFSVFINPFFFIRRSLYMNIKRFAPRLEGKMLDFGCGRKPFENLFSVKQYVGLDIEQSGHDHKNSKVDVFYDGKTIPFEAETFDSLFCSEVIEHVFNPDEVLPEMNRVLKKGALVLITVPFCWNEHEVPYDYARYSSFGITHLLEKNGFKVLELEKSGNFVRVNFQLWALYFFEQFKRWGKVGYALSLLFIAPLNLLGSILLPLFPKNKSLFFNNIVLAQKVA